jgi:hypothetical protein
MYTLYNPADIRWDVLNDIMSLYFLCFYRIFRLNGVAAKVVLLSFDRNREHPASLVIIGALTIGWEIW